MRKLNCGLFDPDLAGFIAALRGTSVLKALALLHAEPARDWTIDEIAGRVPLSRATLIRRFRDNVGAAPIEKLNNNRLLSAHQRLKRSAKSIEQIAAEVGFASAQTLTRAFKRQYGYTPQCPQEENYRR